MRVAPIGLAFLGYWSKMFIMEVNPKTSFQLQIVLRVPWIPHHWSSGAPRVTLSNGWNNSSWIMNDFFLVLIKRGIFPVRPPVVMDNHSMWRKLRIFLIRSPYWYFLWGIFSTFVTWRGYQWLMVAIWKRIPFNQLNLHNAYIYSWFIPFERNVRYSQAAW